MDARPLLRFAHVLACVAVFGPSWAGAAEPTGTPSERADVELATDLGPWTDGVDLAVRLRTPRSALETFLAAGAVGRFELAAGVLNLSDVPTAMRADVGPELAEKLHFVLHRRLAIEWREIPDRADGARDFVAASVEDAVATAPAPRHDLRIGEVASDPAPVEIRLERVQAADGPSVWLIARSTVRSIDVLYEQHGPGWIERNAPGWALLRLGAAPTWQWLAFVLLVALSVAFGWVVQLSVLRWLATPQQPRVHALVRHTARPLAVLAGVSVLWLTSSTLVSLAGAPGRFVSTTLTALFVLAITWLAKNGATSFAEYVVQKWLGGWGESDGKETQRSRTNLSVARRAIVFVVLLVGLAIAMAQFAAFRTIGASLLASAGVAGIILGVAAQSSLSSVVAGIQIALTKLVRIGDAVYFEEHWSTVEDITYTYVVLRTWDERRIAVPNRYVITHPLQNWAMSDPNMILPVILHVDYRTPVEALRRRYVEVLEAAEDWDRVQAPKLQVIDATRDTLQVRMLCSAKDATTAWDLHCHVREELVAFLRDWDDGRYLPRSRLRIEGQGALAANGGPATAG